MRRRSGGGVGLLLITFGAATIMGLLHDRDPWPHALPGVLVGLSMVAFGWSALTRGRRDG